MSHTTTIKSVPIKSIAALRATVLRLKADGKNVELLENAIPRMFYEDQLQRHKGRESEICPYVLKCHDCAYDIGFIPQADGSLEPVFDSYGYPGPGNRATYKGASDKAGISNVLGAKWDGPAEHWSGNREETEGSAHNVGRFLQFYAAETAIEAATNAGYAVESTTFDDKGNLHIQIAT